MATSARPRVVAGLRLVRPVGEGGEGEVWEARDRAGRRRALKLIRPDALVSPAEVERRGRWLLAIDHPALVAVHRCGVLSGAGLDGWGFVEMAFVDGPTLDEARPDRAALERLEPLAEALDLLHAGTWSEGVPLVHRDVKPANLIEQTDGALVLVDASTLRDVDDGTRTRIGTPLYAAPEVVTGRAGPLADVYGFAATAVALLTGARRGELAALLADPQDLDIPEGLRAALAPDPADRPVSCRAALDPRLPLIVGHEVGWGPTTDGAADEPDPYEDPATSPGAELDHAVESWAEPWRRPHDRDAAWLPAASDVLLEPWVDPYEPLPAAVRGRPWPWLLLLGALLAVPLAAAGQTADLREGAPTLLAAAVGHLLVCLAGGRGVMEALLAPPWAWASLLAERGTPPGPARAWTTATLLSCLTVAGGLALAPVLLPERLDATAAAPLVAAAVLVAAVALAAGRGGRFWRLVLAPAWALGALVIVAVGALLLLPAVLGGRGGVVLAAVARALGGAAAFVRRA